MNNIPDNTTASGKRLITLKTKTGDVYQMSLNECSRWLALIEGVDLIQERALKLNVDLDATDAIKPLALEKYINERAGDILVDLCKDPTVLKDSTISVPVCITSPVINSLPLAA